MPKNDAEDIKPGLPVDFAGAAEADGVEVPPIAKQPPKDAPKPEVVVEEPKPATAKPAGKPSDGRDHVTFDDPAVEARFNRMYRQVKAQDENQKIQGATLEKLLKDKTELERKLADRESKDALELVREKIKTARDNGNVDEEDNLREQLIGLTTEFEVKKRLPALESAPARALPADKPTQDPYAVLSASDKAEINRWATAEDNDGNLVRPWASRQDNTRAALAAQLLAGVLNQTAQDDLTMAEKLALVDEQMGTQAPAARRQTPVMGTNLTPRGNTPKPKITSDQAKIARKLFPHLSDQDAYRAYVDGGL